jgi:glycosyltransferase involved in cell wall biosynthesis
VPEIDFFELSKEIIKLIEDNELGEKMGINGYKLVKAKFNWNKIAENYQKVY